jgi:hypothetical protein
LSLSAGVRSVFGFLYKAVKQGIDLTKTAASLVASGFKTTVAEISVAAPKLIDVILRRPKVTLVNLPTKPSITDMSETPIRLSDNYLVNYNVTLRNLKSGVIDSRSWRLAFSELPSFNEMLDSPYSVLGASEELIGVEIESIWVNSGVWSSWGEYGTYWG